jgi:hypothetical protein
MRNAMTRADFAALLDRMNAPPGRTPGQCSPIVCRIHDEGGETARVVNVVLAWEVKARRQLDGTFTGPGRMATAADMEVVAAIAAQMQQGRAA